MMWLVTLLILAIIAYFVVKSVSSNIRNRQAGSNSSGTNEIDHANAQQHALANSGSTDDNGSASASSESMTRQGSNAIDSSGAGQSSTAASTSSSRSSATTGIAATAAGATVAGAVASAVAGSSAEGSTHHSAGGGISSGNTLSDVREMIKILNLDAPDASRLAIDREQLVALRKGDANGIPDASSLEEIAVKLRNMLA